MKKLLLAIYLILSTVIFSQSINGVPLKDINVDYVQIVGTTNLMENKVTIDIDFGKRLNLWSGSDTKLLDASGNPVKLNSMIDALNFVCSNGYEFVTGYTLIDGSQNVYLYLLKKRNNN